jgi:uncharacterized protein (DUF1330 family)
LAAYIIAYVDVVDPQEYEEYRRLVAPTIELFGGRYVVRAGRYEVLEGDIDPKRVVIIEFPSMERAKAWHDSAEYAPALAIRHRAATSRLVLVEGV